MKTRSIGVILNGVTGRMGTNQHLVRSILAIRKQGGVRLADGSLLMPEPVLTGRNEEKLRLLAETHGVSRYTTRLEEALADPANEIFFDASSTQFRSQFVEQAVKAGKAIYCEKPTATTTGEALRLARLCEDAGVKNGVVQDKLWLPGFEKLKHLMQSGFFGDILSVRGEFGYWVFTGEDPARSPQRPSWNYRQEEGGSMILDMFCHWRYLIDHLFGPVKSVSCRGAIHVPRRVDEAGNAFPVTADDSAYATFELENGILCQFNSSWCVRVRRDDLLTLQVDGTGGSAVAGLRRCWAQSAEQTPRAVWNPDIDSPIDFRAGWEEVREPAECDNAFKVEWELFLKHVAEDAPFPYSLRDGAKGVQLAEAALESWRSRCWVDLPALT